MNAGEHFSCFGGRVLHDTANTTSCDTWHRAAPASKQANFGTWACFASSKAFPRLPSCLVGSMVTGAGSASCSEKGTVAVGLLGLTAWHSAAALRDHDQMQQVERLAQAHQFGKPTAAMPSWEAGATRFQQAREGTC